MTGANDVRGGPVASIDRAAEPDAAASPRVLVSATLLWGGEVVAVRHVRPARELRVRDLGLEVPGPGDLVVATGKKLRLPSGGAVPAGYRMALRFGRVALRVELVADDAVRVARARPDGRVAYGLLAAAALHLVFVALAGYGRAPVADGEREERAAMERYMAAAEARALAELAEQAARAARPRTEPPRGARSREDEGAAGNPARTADGARRRESRGLARRARASGGDDPRSFGILALLAADAPGDGAGTSAFAVAADRAAVGNLFGATIEDAAGAAGLGLSGDGEGGGGLGAGVPLSTTAAAGAAVGSRLMLAPRRELREHRPLVASFECRCDETQVNGRLPPEAVQRVVRRSFGRLRACYADGLRRDPGLEGRVSVKFVIDREGAVTMASVAEGTLPDASVRACVARAYEAMAFPKPAGGIVTVVYPVVFSHDG